MAYNYYEEAYAKEDLSKCVLEPKIELTLEEAKHLLSIVMDSAYDHCVTQEESDVFHKFSNQIKQIEQAEATKICNDYSEALNKAVEAFQKQEEIIRLKCEIEQLKAEQEVDNYLKNQFLKSVRNKE